MSNERDFTVQEVFNFAVQNHQNNNLQDAQSYYQKVLKIDPNYIEAHNNLGVIFRELGDLQKAKNCYEKAIEINPNYLDAHNNLGNIFLKLGDLQKAKECYEKAIEINPNHAIAHKSLGIIFRKLEEYQKAKNCYEKVIEINPNHVDVHNNLGNIFLKLGDLQKAKECYEKALTLKPNHTTSIYNLGVVLFAAKQYKNAKEQFKLINYKDSRSFLLSCSYEIDDKFTFFDELDNSIKKGDCNPIIGSLTSRSEVKYGIKKVNPFCGDAFKYILMTNLIEEYDFKNIFVKPINDALEKNIFSSTRQSLLKNGYQTTGNIFAKKNDFFDKIKNIINFEVKKYQENFKESKEGFITNWPKSYSINAWLINMKNGGKLDPHMHEYGWLSGSIYINVPPKLEVDSGNLVVCIDDQVSESEKNTNPKKIMPVVTGSLCLFPSSLYHYTVPFKSIEERIVLAFDVKPD